MSTPFTHRYCATFLVEAATPLKIGTGQAGLTIDELVATDANGLPMIPATALCGVLRHSLATTLSDGEETINSLFGYQDKDKGSGSRIIFSEGRLLGDKGQVIDGLKSIDKQNSFYSKIQNLAVRDHCKINDRGTAVKHGKFDSQVVFKGARFVFEIELVGNESDQVNWENLFKELRSPLFRIGGGTRKGFGELSIINHQQKTYDLSDKDLLSAYLNKSSQLTVPGGSALAKDTESQQTTTYQLNLTPDDFFIFSSGYGDKDADDVAKKEITIAWDNGKPSFTKEQALIPATSVKGALSHRTAFYYNKLSAVFAENLPEGKEASDFVGENSPAVQALFGFAKDSGRGDNHGQRGRTIISDIFVAKTQEKILNHVAIDRFTGGALDGALFDEKVSYSKDSFTLTLTVENDAFNNDNNIQSAFESALKDITNGMLPLGGKTMRGHGCFNGTITRNNEAI